MSRRVRVVHAVTFRAPPESVGRGDPGPDDIDGAPIAAVQRGRCLGSVLADAAEPQPSRSIALPVIEAVAGSQDRPRARLADRPRLRVQPPNPVGQPDDDATVLARHGEADVTGHGPLDVTRTIKSCPPYLTTPSVDPDQGFVGHGPPGTFAENIPGRRGNKRIARRDGGHQLAPSSGHYQAVIRPLSGPWQALASHCQALVRRASGRRGAGVRPGRTPSCAYRSRAKRVWRHHDGCMHRARYGDTVGESMPCASASRRPDNAGPGHNGRRPVPTDGPRHRAARNLPDHESGERGYRVCDTRFATGGRHRS
jgi:hypothetical protein